MNLLPFHITAMSIAFASMVVAICIAHWSKKNKRWLKAHKTLNIISVVSLIIGFTLAFIMVQSTGGPHFRVDHGIIGGMALLLSLCVLYLGFAIFKSKDKHETASLKKAHRWAGRADLLMLIFAILEGLDLAGIL
ncbi:MAG: hypothetical protein LLF89_00955 [Spirochaetaceae bacterium]|nr:hypothetical protein [Spirochaetaceae bacterium]